MKTTHEHRPDEITKRLFRQLFEAQFELERCADDSDPQLRMIIVAVDDLMGKILDYKDE